MRDRTEARLLALAPSLYLALFFALPVLALLGYAAMRSDRGPVETVLRLATTPYYSNRILFTLEQATLSTLLTLLAGLPLAYLFSHCEFPGRRILRAALTAPFVLPSLVVALALQAWMGPRGVLGVDVLGALGPLGAILLAHVFYNLSLMIRLVGNIWERLPLAYLEAARTLGLTRAQTWWRVELPLLRPALLAASLLTFVFCSTSFGIILLLGGSRVGTLETLVYEEVRSFRPDYATAAALAILQLAITYVALLAFVRLQQRGTAAWRPRTQAKRSSLPAWGFLVLSLAAFFEIGPPLALLASSLHTRQGWGFDAFTGLFGGQPPLESYTTAQALGNSLRFALGTLALALPLAFVTALAAHRRRNAATQVFVLLPLGLSAVVVGLGFLLTWNGTLLPDLRTSGLWIVLAHTLIGFPLAARILLPSLDAVEPALREAARTLGASRRHIVWRLELPLSYAALGVAAVYAFATSLGEFGAALLLRRPSTTTLPLAIYDAFSRPGPVFREQAMALAALLFLAAFASFLVLERARVRTWGEFA